MTPLGFIEAVAQLPLSKGDAAFDRWLTERGLDRTALAAEDVRRDIIRGVDGKTYTRYWVRKSVVDQTQI